MSCATGLVPPVFFVRWETPQITDIIRIKTELAKAYDANHGPVIYVTIAPEDSAPPDEAMRKGFVDSMEEVLKYCDTMHFVMEGQGFKHSILRSALATVLLVRAQRTRTFVHRSLDEALAAANRASTTGLKIDIPSVIRQAMAKGLVTVPPTGKLRRR
jgi:hypothetical protein